MRLAGFLLATVLCIGLLQPMVVRAAEDGEPDAAWKTAHSGLQEMEIVELPVHEEAEEPLVQRSAAVDKEGYVYAMGGGTAVITATCGELSDTCTITVNVPVVDPVEQFVTRMYEVTLDRTPDEGGLATWVNGLKNHTFTGQDIAKGFIMSEELTAKNLDDAAYVDVLYKAFFDRAADAAVPVMQAALLHG